MTLSLKPSDVEQSKYKAPDGGWGWVIVASSLVIHIIMDGITYSLGTYLTIFTENFGVSHAEASFVHSLLPAITLSCGPIASILTNKFGCRMTTIIGSLIAFLGFFLSCFIKKFFFLYITIGVIVGFGFGLIYVPAIVSVGYYFDKKRSLAIGIAVCGSGIGTFVLSPVNRILVENYGWSGAFLIKSALCLNLCVCGALMKPVSVEPSEILKRNRKKNKMCLSNKKDTNNNCKIENNLNELESNDNLIANKPKILVSDERNQIIYSNGLNTSDPNNLQSISNAEPKEPNKKVTILMTRSSSNRTKKNGTEFGVNSSKIDEIAKSLPMLGERTVPLILHNGDIKINESVNPISQISKSTNSALDILAQVKSLQNIPVTCFESSSLNEIEKKMNANENVNSNSLKEKILEAIDFKLFKNSLFVFFIISNFLTSLGFNVPYIYIVDQATLLKIKPELADLLLSTIGISNSIGRLILGVLGDLKGVNRIYLYSSVLSICGIATIVEPFCKDFYSLFIYAIVFGLSSGGYVSLTSVLIVDLLGLDKLTNAFGILLVFQGIATSIGPPLVGIMFDSFNSYVIAFVLTGIMISISGLMCFLIPLIQIYSREE